MFGAFEKIYYGVLVFIPNAYYSHVFHANPFTHDLMFKNYSDYSYVEVNAKQKNK